MITAAASQSSWLANQSLWVGVGEEEETRTEEEEREREREREKRITRLVCKGHGPGVGGWSGTMMIACLQRKCQTEGGLFFGAIERERETLCILQLFSCSSQLHSDTEREREKERERERERDTLKR